MSANELQQEDRIFVLEKLILDHLEIKLYPEIYENIFLGTFNSLLVYLYLLNVYIGRKTDHDPVGTIVSNQNKRVGRNHKTK